MKKTSDNFEMFQALNWEALRRRTTYGKLVAALNQGEDREIYDRYIKAKAERERREFVSKGQRERGAPKRKRLWNTAKADTLREQGRTYKAIAAAVGTTEGAVQSYFSKKERRARGANCHTSLRSHQQSQ